MDRRPPAGQRDWPTPAGICNWLSGGVYSIPVDRVVAAAAVALLPELPQMARANRAFIHRAVSVAASAGVRQFLDLGSGLPAPGAVHTVAGSLAPGARVVYVDIDGEVTAAWQELLDDDADAGAVCADLLDAEAVLANPTVRERIDWSQSVCLLATAVAHLIPDTPALTAAFERYRVAACHGSHMVISHCSLPKGSELGSQLIELYGRNGIPLVARGGSELVALLARWELIDPGLVHTWQWRPDAAGFGVADADQLTLAAVALKAHT